MHPFALVLLLAASPLLGKLEPGPYAVGFQQWARYDYARGYRPPAKLDASPREGERSRPMQINIWYPAEKATGSGPLTLGDYLSMIPVERRFGSPAASDVRTAETGFLQYTFPKLDLTPEQRARLRPLAGLARRDSRPAKGRFPLILFSLNPAAMLHATCEYLASHGYVVMTMPRVPLSAGLPDTGQNALDIDAKVRDMEFLINAAHAFPAADLGNLGVVGFSAGGWWGLSEVMRNPAVHAMVSLDTVMLFDDAARKAWQTLPYFDLDAVRVPVLHMIRKEWVPQEDAKMWQGMRYAERLSLQFQDPQLTHWDFQSIGYALTRTGARASAALAVDAAFHLFNRYTLAFFDAHLKRDARAREWLGRGPEENGAPAGFVVASALKGEPAPRTLAEFMAAVEEDSLEHVIAAYRSEWTRTGTPAVAEVPMNLAGYTLLGEGRTEDAIRVFELNAEAFPASANVYDSLGDACLQAGDKKRAKELAQKTLDVLETDASLTPERKLLIKGAAEDKRKQLP